MSNVFLQGVRLAGPQFICHLHFNLSAIASCDSERANSNHWHHVIVDRSLKLPAAVTDLAKKI
jgi:hypothetical protein